MFGLNPAELLVALLMFGGSTLPVGLPPLPADPQIERAAPDECLYYSSWNGTADPDPKSKNLTEQLLAEPEVQQFGEQLGKQIQKALHKAAPPDACNQMLAKTVPGLLRTLAMRPGVLYVSKVVPTPPNVVVDAALLVSAGDEETHLRKSLEWLEGLLVDALPDGAKIEAVTIAGVDFKRLTLAPGAPVALWGFKGSLFILAVGEGEAKALLGRLDDEHKVPAWLQTVREKLPSDRPAGVNYVNLAGILEIAAPFITDPTVKVAIDTLGISQLKSLASVYGLEGQGTVLRSLLAVDGEPTGLLKLIPSQPLAAEDLKTIPREATVAGIVRFNVNDAYRTGLELAAAFDPGSVDRFQTQLAQAEQQIGLRLVDDLLKPLGDRWALYSSPEEGGSLWTMSGLVATATLADRDRFAATHDRVLTMVRGALAGRDKPEARIRETTIDGTKVYTLQMSIPVPVAPSWAITKDRVIVTLNRQMMKAVLQRSSQAASLANIDAVRAALEKGPSALSYQDTDSLVTSLYPLVQLLDPLICGGLAQQGIEFELPTLPSLSVVRRHLTPTVSTLRRTDDGFVSEQSGSIPANANAAAIGMAVGLALPALNAAREKGRRQVSMNDLRQVGIALLSAENTDGRFPDPAIRDAQGKPLLSWRVAILPFIEQEALYRSFHLDEPWDSPNNRPLLQRMPGVYTDRSHPELTAAGRTRYLLPRGQGTLFKGDHGLSPEAIHDGSSYTILLVEASPELAVPWTKPEDVAIDPKNAAASLKLKPTDRLQVIMADGSVRFLPGTIDPATLRRLLDPADGEVIDTSQF